MSGGWAVRPLAGLPPYGPPALSFPKPNAFSEGFVVEFAMDDGESWVGNFAKWDQRKSSIHDELGAEAIVVLAGGAGYVVDARRQRLVREIGFDLQHIWFDPRLGAMVISNGLWFVAFDALHVLWRSRRLSWDGVRNIARSATEITGEAFDPSGEEWTPFRLTLATGEIEGGSYNGL